MMTSYLSPQSFFNKVTKDRLAPQKDNPIQEHNMIPHGSSQQIPIPEPPNSSNRPPGFLHGLFHSKRYSHMKKEVAFLLKAQQDLNKRLKSQNSEKEVLTNKLESQVQWNDSLSKSDEKSSQENFILGKEIIKMISEKDGLNVEIIALRNENDDFKKAIQNHKLVESSLLLTNRDLGSQLQIASEQQQSLASKVVELDVPLLNDKWLEQKEEFVKELEGLNFEILDLRNQIDEFQNMTAERLAKEETLIQFNNNLKVQLENCNKEQQYLASKVAELQLEASISNDKLTGEIEELVKEKFGLNGDIIDLRKEVEEFHERNHELSSLLECTNEQQQYLESKLADVEQEFALTKDKMITARDANEQILLDKNTDLCSQLESANEQRQDIESKFPKLQQRVSILNDKRTAEKKEWIRKKDEMSRAIIDLRYQVENFQKLSTDKEELVSAKDGLNIEIVNLRHENKEFKKWMKYELDKEKEGLKLEVVNLRKEIEEFRTILTDRNAKEQPLLQENNDLCSPLEQARKLHFPLAVTELKHDVSILNGKYEELVKEKGEMNSDIIGLRKQIQSSASKVAGLQLDEHPFILGSTR